MEFKNMIYEGFYDYLLTSDSKDQWRRIGIQRRAGVVAPLFSIYSSESIGIGELPDLKFLIDWCKVTGMSIIQLLPLNDVGFNFRPYDAQSTFALDPMYLSIPHLIHADVTLFKDEIKKVKEAFPTGKMRVNYRIKSAKLSLLWQIFKSRTAYDIPVFNDFIQDNAFWIWDYALFKAIKEENDQKSWEDWNTEFKFREEEAIHSFQESHRERLLFQIWMQWQLFEQMRKVKQYAEINNILIMGDLPFLVSRDSVDVWSHQQYFKLDLSAGAPPDMLYSKGQRWGLPPHQWGNIAANNYDYIKERLRFAQNFYDLYRIDHVVGIFRVWTIPLSEPVEYAGLRGAFDPRDEQIWEERGRRLLSVMVRNTSMLACAEDLGTVPACVFKVLKEFGIPGIDVQRWMRDWAKTYDFKKPEEYRTNSIATIATHDMSGLCAWWEFEAGTIDEGLFKRKCQEKNIIFESVRDKLFDLKKSSHGRLRWKKEITNAKKLLSILGLDDLSAKDLIDLYMGSYDEQEKFLQFLEMDYAPESASAPLFIKKVLEKISSSASIFSCPLLHDWLSLDAIFDCDPWELRINFPGTLSEKNWTLVIPLSLEDMLALPVNRVIKSINKQSSRT